MQTRQHLGGQDAFQNKKKMPIQFQISHDPSTSIKQFQANAQYDSVLFKYIKQKNRCYTGNWLAQAMHDFDGRNEYNASKKKHNT